MSSLPAVPKAVTEHKYFRCEDHGGCKDLGHCQFCEGGLGYCTVCGGFEGTLTTECCGRRITQVEADHIYDQYHRHQGEWLDYQDGSWIVLYRCTGKKCCIGVRFKDTLCERCEEEAGSHYALDDRNAGILVDPFAEKGTCYGCEAVLPLEKMIKRFNSFFCAPCDKEAFKL